MCLISLKQESFVVSKLLRHECIDQTSSLLQVDFETVSMQFPSFREKWLLHWLILGHLPPFFCQRSMGQAISLHGDSRFSLTRTLDCPPVHFYTMVFIWNLWIRLIEKAGKKRILEKDMKWSLLALRYNTCHGAGFTALLKTFLSGQCIKTSGLFWVLAAAAADVGGGFLRTVSLRG